MVGDFVSFLRMEKGILLPKRNHLIFTPRFFSFFREQRGKISQCEVAQESVMAAWSASAQLKCHGSFESTAAVESLVCSSGAAQTLYDEASSMREENFRDNNIAFLPHQPETTMDAAAKMPSIAAGCKRVYSSAAAAAGTINFPAKTLHCYTILSTCPRLFFPLSTFYCTLQ